MLDVQSRDDNLKKVLFTRESLLSQVSDSFNINEEMQLNYESRNLCFKEGE